MILLFDLAGVLLDFRGVERTFELSGGSIDAERFQRFWSQSPLADRLYRGQITPAEFASGVVAEWSLRVSPEEFLGVFQRWLIGPYPGSFDLLAKLRRHHELACLSNTNELDCGRFRNELHLHERFDWCFFSNEIGLRKPERECYVHVLNALGAMSSDVIFFDDNAECVEGARAVGLQAHQCAGIQELAQQLKVLGLLGAPERF